MNCHEKRVTQGIQQVVRLEEGGQPAQHSSDLAPEFAARVRDIGVVPVGPLVGHAAQSRSDRLEERAEVAAHPVRELGDVRAAGGEKRSRQADQRVDVHLHPPQQHLVADVEPFRGRRPGAVHEAVGRADAAHARVGEGLDDRREPVPGQHRPDVGEDDDLARRVVHRCALGLFLPAALRKPNVAHPPRCVLRERSPRSRRSRRRRRRSAGRGRRGSPARAGCRAWPGATAPRCAPPRSPSGGDHRCAVHFRRRKVRSRASRSG